MLLSRCKVCSNPANLFRCSQCAAVEYCSSAHRDADHAVHAPQCARVRQAVVKVYNEIDLLGDNGGYEPLVNDMKTNLLAENLNPDPGNIEPPYIHARWGLVRVLLALDTPLAIETAYTHVVDLNRMNYYDSMSADLTTYTLIRRNCHQTCYDYISWWAENLGIWPETNDNPLLNPERTESLESVLSDASKLETTYAGILYTCALPLVYLKIYWLRELEDLAKFRTVERWFTQKLNFDITEVIRGHMIDSDIMSTPKRRILWNSDNSEIITDLKQQVEHLYAKPKDFEKAFWECLIMYVEGRVDDLPDAYKPDEDAGPGFSGTIRDLLELNAELYGREDGKVLEFIKDLVQRDRNTPQSSG